MAYYFECKECNHKETYNYVMNTNYYGLAINQGQTQSYETVICSGCIKKKTKLKGNYIIIERTR